jgi:RNA recognition motif-containing protein
MSLATCRDTITQRGSSGMKKLWLGNLPDDTSDETLKEFLEKYGAPIIREIEHADGTGTRPGVLVTFEEGPPAALERLVKRLNGLFWNGKTLFASAVLY